MHTQRHQLRDIPPPSPRICGATAGSACRAEGGSRRYLATNQVGELHFTHRSERALWYVLCILLAFPLLSIAPRAQAQEQLLFVNDTFLPVRSNVLRLDEDDSGGDVILQFGKTLIERILWDNALGSFRITDDLEVQGTLSGTSLTVSGLKNCDTIDTDANGNLACGTDDGAGGGISLADADARYVNQSGDTMTGNLIVGNAATLSVSGAIITEGNLTINEDNAAVDAVLTFGNDTLAETLRFSDATNGFIFSDDLEVQGTLSGRALQVTGTGAIPLFFTDVTTGRVGIGTTSPNADLHINSGISGNKLTQLQLNLDYAGGVGNGGLIKFRQVNAFDINQAAIYAEYQNNWGSSLNFMTRDTTSGEDADDLSNLVTRMTIDENGNVDIFATSNGKALHLDTTSANGPDIFFTDADTGNVVDSDGLQLGMDDNEHGFFWNYESAGDIYFGAGNAEVMRIDSGGNVGIGTTSPETALEVVGTMSGRSLQVTGTGAIPLLFTDSTTGRVGMGTASPGANLHLADTGPLQLILEADTDDVTETDIPSILFRRDGGTDSFRIGVEGSAGTAFVGSLANTPYMQSLNTPFGLQFATNGNARMTLEPGGDIGIGTTNPSAELDVIGVIEVSNEIQILDLGSATDPGITWENDGNTGMFTGGADILGFTTGGSEAMRIDPNGQVGIGTISPATAMHIVGESTAATTFRATRFGSGSPRLELFRGNGTVSSPTPLTSGDSAGILFFGGAYNTTPSFDAGAGINAKTTENWSATARGTKLEFKTVDNGTTTRDVRMTIDQNGKVGIGTTTPQAFFDVSSSLDPINGTTDITLANVQMRVMNNVGSTGDGSGIKFGASSVNGNPGGGAIVFERTGSNAQGRLHFATKETTGADSTIPIRMTIANDGKVGIGDTEPDMMLHIEGADPEIYLHGTSGNAFESGRIRLAEQTSGGSNNFKGGFIHFDGSANVFNIGVHDPGDQITGNDVNAISIDRSTAMVGIGDVSPDEELKVVGGFCVADAAGDTCTTANGDIDADGAINANNFDLAEKFLTDDTTLAAGEIVTFDPAKPTTHVVRAGTPDAPLIGIISTDPSLVMGYAVTGDDFDESQIRPVALVGRVPVRVNLEGGDIAVGDRIALSSVPGIGRKATRTLPTIGIALEPFTAQSTGDRIQVFLSMQGAYDR